MNTVGPWVIPELPGRTVKETSRLNLGRRDRWRNAYQVALVVSGGVKDGGETSIGVLARYSMPKSCQVGKYSLTW